MNKLILPDIFLPFGDKKLNTTFGVVYILRKTKQYKLTKAY